MLSTLAKSVKNLLTTPNNWLSLIAGLSLVFAYAPFSLWWLPFISLPLWFFNLKGSSIKTAAKHGFIFGFGWFASGISWVHVAIDQFGGLPLIVSVLVMILLCLYLALFPALACYLSAKLSKTKQVDLWLFSIFWLVTEYFRGIFLTGFPWLSLGYTQVDSPLSSLIPIVGEFGLSSVILLLCIAIYQLIRRNNLLLSLSIILSIVVTSFALKEVKWVTPTDNLVKVALVQGNIKQSIKWEPDQEWPTMLKYLDLTRVNYDADIIIWPESAITAIEPLAQEFLMLANKSAALQNSAIITGILNYDFESKEYFNNLITLGKKHKSDDDGNYKYNHLNRYSKYHLLPIGEFVPFQEWLRPIAPLFNLPQSSFSAGKYVQPNLVANDINILPLICFEIAFPDQLKANFNTKTDILLTVSNDSWFGDSHGPHQHLDIARMRAAEFGRPLLRATNNGVTAVVDHAGMIVDIIPQFTEQVLRAEVILVEGETPYSKWGQFISWFFALVTLTIYLINHLLKRKKQ